MPILTDVFSDYSALGTLQSELLTNEPPSPAHNGENIRANCVITAFCLFLSVKQPTPASKNATSCLGMQRGNEQQTVSGILASELKISHKDGKKKEEWWLPDGSGKGHGPLSKRTSEPFLFASPMVQSTTTSVIVMMTTHRHVTAYLLCTSHSVRDFTYCTYHCCWPTDCYLGFRSYEWWCYDSDVFRDLSKVTLRGSVRAETQP